MLVLAVFAAFLAVALILFATLSQAEEKATIRDSLHGGDAAGWASFCGHDALAERLRRRGR